MPRKKAPVLPTAPDAALRALAEAKLASSGLTLEDAAQLGIKLLTPAETMQTHVDHAKFPYSSLLFPYFDPAGALIKEGAQPIFRLRFLDAPASDPNKGILTGKKSKPLRYAQPPNTAPYPYYAANQDWSEILADTDQTLIITEGELKAAKACKEGFPTIGLGGVHSWKSHKKGIEWLPHLAEPWVQWAKRKVVICFDSDYATNPQVCDAIHALGEQLERRGAYVHLVTLPTLPDFEGKVGLDDFLTFGGPSADGAFTTLLRGAAPLGLGKPLWDLNAKYCYVRDPGLLVDRKTRAKSTPSAFTGHLESTSEYISSKLDIKTGELCFEPVMASMAWLKWPLRTEAARVTYRPGQAEFVDNELNLWPGWGCQPKKGDVKPFLKLIDHLFEGAEPEAKTWFLRWLAYPLQHPGTKLFTAVVVHGVMEGTGKSLVGYTMSRIYGKNFTAIGQSDLQSGFNAWAAEKQFVMGDDVTGTNRFEQADLLKKLITQEEIRINIKHMPEFVVPDCLNYYFNSNRPDSFLMGDRDRRMFIHEVTVMPLEQSFYIAYRDWLKAEGPSAVFDYLLHLDLGEWDPAAPALRTHAKARMVDDVRTSLGHWVATLRDAPDSVTVMGEMVINKDLFTAKELLAFYDPEEKTKTTFLGLAREMRSMAMPMVMQGAQIRTKDGKQNRYYVVRNHEHWAKCTSAKEVSDYVDNWKAEPKRRKF